MSFWPFFKSLIKKLLDKAPWLECFYWEYVKFRIRSGRLVEKNMFRRLITITDYSENEKGLVSKRCLGLFLNYVLINVPYYRDLSQKGFIDSLDIKTFPVITKADFRENFKDFISLEYTLPNLLERSTGGSTGEPFKFYSDAEAGFRDNAHHWYLYSLMGHVKADVIASCGGFVIPKKKRNNNIYWITRYHGHVFGDVAFSALYLNDGNVKYYVDKLLKIKPDILRGYPSFFDSLANYIITFNVELDFKVKGINLTAEMCTDSQRKRIERAFNSIVYFEYGHTEISIYCYTKGDNYDYYSSPVYGYVEVLDDTGRDVQAGDAGRVVVTGFNNKGMPFVRYDTGDIAELKYRSEGYVVFNKLYGRNQDFLWTEKNQKVYLTALVFGQHVKAFGNIDKWQLYQDTPGVVLFKIVKGQTYSIEDEKEIIDSFCNVANFELIFNYVDFIEKTRAGKHLFLVQRCKIENFQ